MQKVRTIRLKTFTAAALSATGATGGIQEQYDAWRKTLKEADFVRERAYHDGANHCLLVYYIA